MTRLGHEACVATKEGSQWQVIGLPVMHPLSEARRRMVARVRITATLIAAGRLSQRSMRKARRGGRGPQQAKPRNDIHTSHMDGCLIPFFVTENTGCPGFGQ